MIGLLDRLARPLLRALDPEDAHALVMRALPLAPAWPMSDPLALAVEAFGLHFANPLRAMTTAYGAVLMIKLPLVALALWLAWRVRRRAELVALTAVLLAVARAAGETAPLLFTSLNNQYWNWRADQPTASLTVQIFNYAVSPYDNWHQKAWAASLVLLMIVGALSLSARFITLPLPGMTREELAAALKDHVKGSAGLVTRFRHPT